MADISVDLDMLNQTANALSTLISDFSDAAKIVSDADINDPTIGKALDNFTGDWKVKVGDLISSMKSVQSMASQGYSGYTTTDNQLAQSLQQSS
jgi:D-alanyl-D-alanine carboxypeptidase